jgi:hypothetical protein
MSVADEILWIVSFAIFLFFVVYCITTFSLLVMSLVETSLTKIERGELLATGTAATSGHQPRRAGVQHRAADRRQRALAACV